MAIAKDLTGQRFGRLVAVCPTEKRSGTSIVWECRCDCGNTTYAAAGSLKSGNTNSCGCLCKESVSRSDKKKAQESNSTAGKKIKYYRKLRGMTQEHLAYLSGIGYSSLQQYEIGYRDPSLSAINKIASVLHISPAALLGVPESSLMELLPHILTIAKIGDIQFYGEKGSDGTNDVNTLCITFKSKEIMSFIKKWADMRENIEQLRNQALHCSGKWVKKRLLEQADEAERELELFSAQEVLLDRRCEVEE